MFRIGIITASDKGGAIGEREDLSGKTIEEIVGKYNYIVERKVILPDDEEKLFNEMVYMADKLKLDLILTTGGEQVLAKEM